MFDKPISFDDYDTRRELIFDSAKAGIEKSLPIENDKFRLEVEDLSYKENKPVTLKEEKEAITTGKSLTRGLQGRFVLKDIATGAVVERGSKRLLANVPYLTRRGTFIRNGSENVVINQMRMVPGAYSRKTDNGLFETLVNVRAGTGNAFKLMFDPATAEFTFRVGARKIAAYPILKTMGATDEELKAEWGDDIYKKNVRGNHARTMTSAYSSFIPKWKAKLKEQNEEVSN